MLTKTILKSTKKLSLPALLLLRKYTSKNTFILFQGNQIFKLGFGDQKEKWVHLKNRDKCKMCFMRRSLNCTCVRPSNFLQSI